MEKQIIGLNRATKKTILQDIKTLKEKTIYTDSGGRKRKNYEAMVWNNCLVSVEKIINKY